MVNFLNQFIHAYIYYVQELWWSVLLGFFLSGLFFEFIPGDFVEKHLSQKGYKPILLSSIVGVFLPICCFGSLPVAVTMRNRGARLGPVLAFLVATPATSISALVVCWKLLGGAFTFYIFFVAIIMGLIIGFVGNNITLSKEEQLSLPDQNLDCCHDQPKQVRKSALAKIKGAFVYGFFTLPKEIGLELLGGIAIASFLIIFQPLQDLITQYLTGIIGYAVVLVVGLGTYVCSTASVPMADGLIQSGMSSGQAMTYLLVGPITSYGTILVVKKEFGLKTLLIYLFLIALLSLMFGVLFDRFF